MGEIAALTKGSFGGASWLVTARAGGVSQNHFAQANFSLDVGDAPHLVKENRRTLKAQIGKPITFPIANHGKNLAWVDEKSSKDIANVDGLITSSTNLAIATLSADCATVLLFAPGVKIIAALHAGWKGMSDGILPKTIQELRASGADEIKAVIGPAICGECYSVSEDRYREVKNKVPAACLLNKKNEFAIDVRAGLEWQLLGEKVAFESVSICSFEEKNAFSFRRDQKTGRMASVIWLNE
jgi:polyphenol oxidase